MRQAVDGDAALGIARRVGLDVAEVAGVTLVGLVAGVLVLRRVEVRAGAAVVGGAEVAFLVDVEPVLAGREALEVVGDLHLVVADLRERDGAGRLAPRRLRRRGGGGLELRDSASCRRWRPSSSRRRPCSSSCFRTRRASANATAAGRAIV